VLTGPLVRSEDTHGHFSFFNRVLANILNKVLPSFQAGNTLDPNDITSDIFNIKMIESDPLFWKGRYKAKFTTASFNALDAVNRQFEKVNIPLFVLHGTEDVVTMPLGSQLLVSGARSRDKELIQIKGKKHHLILDIGGEQVVNTIVQWVNARL